MLLLKKGNANLRMFAMSLMLVLALVSCSGKKSANSDSKSSTEVESSKNLLGNIKLKEDVIYANWIKIPAQSIKISSIKEDEYDGEVDYYFDADVVVESIGTPDKEYGWGLYRIEMKLLDADGIELIYLSESLDDEFEEAGTKKRLTFGFTLANSGRPKEELQEILDNIDGVKFKFDFS